MGLKTQSIFDYKSQYCVMFLQGLTDSHPHPVSF